MVGYRSTNAQLLAQINAARIGKEAERAIETVLKDLPPGGKIIEADMVAGKYELTAGMPRTGIVYEYVLDKSLTILLKEERPFDCPHWVERDVKRAKLTV